MAISRRRRRYIRARKLKRRRQFWEASLKKHYGEMVTFASRFTNGDKSRAEGLIQRIAIRLLSQCPKILSKQATLRYLKRAIKNIWIDNRQRRELVSIDQETEEFFKTLEIPIEPATHKTLEQSEIAARVLQEMEPDHPDLPRLLQLKLEGYTIEEIDKILGKDPGFAQYLWQSFVKKARRLAKPCPGKMRRRSRPETGGKNHGQRPAA